MPHINRTIFMPMDLLQAFSKHTGLSWSSLEIEGAICDAMTAAMEAQPAQIKLPAGAITTGYQWKQVFLPDGTLLRASFDRKPYYAVVEGTEIRYGEYSLSPSAFANLYGSGNRNAWKAIWLRFPGTPDWVRADVCRAVRQAATTRMYEPAPPTPKPEARPTPPAGRYQQQYADEKPSRATAVSPFLLLRSEDEA